MHVLIKRLIEGWNVGRTDSLPINDATWAKANFYACLLLACKAQSFLKCRLLCIHAHTYLYIFTIIVYGSDTVAKVHVLYIIVKNDH